MTGINANAIRARAESLDKKIERLQEGLSAAQRERDALFLTLDLFQAPPEKRTPRQKVTRRKVQRQKVTLSISPGDVRGMPLDNALIYIAEQNAGLLPSTAARELLVEAGVLKGSQVKHKMWSTLSNSDRFKRESKGKYRLVAISEPTSG